MVNLTGKMMVRELSTLKFNINEIFYSIQGEGSRIGLPFVFVRLQGCLLRCAWCDTPYALERKQEEMLMNGSDILNEIEKFQCKNIMLTGGEPLEQEDIFSLITTLCDLGYNVVIETNGQADIKNVDKRAVKIMDFKCPESLMSKKNNYKNVEFLYNTDEVKFVVASEKDYLWAIEVINKYDLIKKVYSVIFSPVFGKLEPRVLAEWILRDKMDVRMQIQMHKFIWEPNKRGV